MAKGIRIQLVKGSDQTTVREGLGTCFEDALTSMTTPKPPDWQFYASCRRCGAPVGTPCLDRRRTGGPLASVTRPHLARPKRDLADCDECGVMDMPITRIADPGGGLPFLICDGCLPLYEPYLPPNSRSEP